MRKRYKKLTAILGLILSFSMAISPVFSFAETGEKPIEEAKKNVTVEENKEKEEVNKEVKSEEKIENIETSKKKESTEKVEPQNADNEKEITKEAKLTLKSGSYGYLAIVNKDKNGKANIISSGEKEEIKKTVGDTLEVAVYGKNPKVNIKGAEIIEKSELPEKANLYKIKINEEIAKFEVAFDFNGNSIFKRIGRPKRSIATSGTITYITGYGHGSTLQATLAVADGNMFGVCCERPNSNVPVKGNALSLTKVDNNSPLGRVAYYGYLNSGNADSLYATSAASTCIRGKNQGTKYNLLSQRIEREARAGTLPAGPSSFECYIGTSGSKQAMLFWRDKPQGKVRLLKSVAENKGITDECKNMYSLAGAEYTVYEDAGLTRTQGKLITKEDGSTNELEENPGIYYVKETKAPKGFALDPVVHEVEIKAGETVTVESKDSPLFDPISIVLKKVADGKSYINPDADMSDAEFTISYYDEMLDDVTGKIPKRVWKIKTIKNNMGVYTANLRNKYLLPDSDELYKTEQGIIIAPRGSLALQETKAPNGFKLDPKVYIYKIDEDSQDHSMQFNFGATPEQPNKPLVPSITTTAMSEGTRENIGEYGKKIKIIDKVSYKELSKGETYTIKGKLMDKETGKTLKDKDGKEITAEKTFTVTKDNSVITGDGASGTVELTYEVDSTLLKGKTTVVFEKLFYKDKEIATHEDINDEGQSVHFVGIKTTATSDLTDSSLGMPNKTETITDTVHCKNLVIGKTYTVKGKLMDKETRKVIKDKENKEITGETTFTADNSVMDIAVKLTYDSSLLQGRKTVVFEKMYVNNTEVATHEDINDKGQTITYPDMGTVAKIKNVGKLTKNKPLTITDKVEYTNLTPFKTYTIKGKAMDRGTGKPFVSNEKEVTAEKTFTPMKKDGYENVEFSFNGKDIEGKSVVIFENMYYEETKIMTHEDINNKKQTVAVGTLTVNYPYGGHGVNTGDKENILIFSILGLAACGLAAFIIYKKNKYEK